MTKIYDLDGCVESDRNNSYAGNSGSKEGILINGERWIVKYPKNTKTLRGDMDMSYNTSPVSEYLGSHIYGILGYPVHETILGLRHGHIVAACKDFRDNHHDLLEFRQLKNTYNAVLNEKLDESFSSTPSSEHFTSFEAVRIHLKYNPALQGVDGLKDRFWDCIVIDGFINNNDRNNGNWGILRDTNGREKDRLAPVYDNGASFSPNIPESKIRNRLNNQKVCEQSACSGRTPYSLDGEKGAFFKELMAQDIPELNDAVIRVVPRIKAHLEEIKTLIEDVPTEYKGIAVISQDRKDEYVKESEIRYEKILLPAYKRAKEAVLDDIQKTLESAGISIIEDEDQPESESRFEIIDGQNGKMPDDGLTEKTGYDNKETDEQTAGRTKAAGDTTEDASGSTDDRDDM